MEQPRGVNMFTPVVGIRCVHYSTSSRRTVRLGSLLGLFESFPIKKLIR